MNSMTGDRIQAAYRLFFNILTRGGGVQELTEAAYRLLNCPILVNDETTNNLAQCPSTPIGDADWDGLLAERNSPTEHFDAFYRKYIRQPHDRQYPLLICDGNRSKTRQFFSVLIDRQRIVGYSAVLLGDREADDTMRSIVSIFNTAVTSVLRQDEESRILTGGQSVACFRRLLEGQGDTSQRTDRGTDNLSVRYPGAYAVVTIQGAETPLEESAASYLCGQLMRLNDGCIALYHEKQLVVLCSGIDTVREEVLTPSLVALLRRYPLKASVSTRFDCLREVYAYYLQASRTMQVGRAKQPHDLIYWYDRLSPLQMFLPLAEGDAAEAYIDPVLRQIYEYDCENGTEYFTTLEQYLHCFLNTKVAARELCVHVNTLLYRIKRMTELFFIDFSDISHMNTLLCNFHLLRASGEPWETLCGDDSGTHSQCAL